MSSDLSQLIVPQVFTPYVLEQSVVRNTLLQSGIILNNPLISGSLAKGGQVTSVLTFRNLDENGTSANASSSDTASSATPEKITGRKQLFTRVGRNKVWTAADWDYSVLGQDPVQYIAASVVNAQMQWRQTSLLKILSGQVAALTSASAANVSAIQTETLPGGGYTSATQINAGNIGTALVSAWGDMGVRDQLADGVNGVAMFVHPQVYRFLTKNDYTSFQRISTQTYGFTTYLGFPIFVDDTMPTRAGTTSGNVYTSYFVRAGGISFGYNAPKNATEVFRAPLAGNGAGADQLFQRDDFAFHTFGMSFTGTAAGDTPTDTELSTGSNWTQVLLAKQTPLVALVHNIDA